MSCLKILVLGERGGLNISDGMCKSLCFGLLINSIMMQFEIPEEKISNFLRILVSVKSQAVMPVRLQARFLGLINLFSRALGQIV